MYQLDIFLALVSFHYINEKFCFLLKKDLKFIQA